MIAVVVASWPVGPGRSGYAGPGVGCSNPPHAVCGCKVRLMLGFVVRGFVGAVVGAFFVWGLVHLFMIPVALQWLLAVGAAVFFFVFAGRHGSRASALLRELWDWFGY